MVIANEAWERVNDIAFEKKLPPIATLHRTHGWVLDTKKTAVKAFLAVFYARYENRLGKESVAAYFQPITGALSVEMELALIRDAGHTVVIDGTSYRLSHIFSEVVAEIEGTDPQSLAVPKYHAGAADAFRKAVAELCRIARLARRAEREHMDRAKAA